MEPVAMRRTTVGFSEPFYERLQEAAGEHGISVSQLVREATLFYLAYEQGLADRVRAQRDEPDTPPAPAPD